jgi:hypothetical protein
MDRNETPGGMLVRTFCRKSIIEGLFGLYQEQERFFFSSSKSSVHDACTTLLVSPSVFSRLPNVKTVERRSMKNNTPPTHETLYENLSD